ncbi:MAG TPA: PRC-barrel domain-containing protein [Chloroflexota bacterium]|nr:PRC-barrel domain-containing protein [Chloroflexota bacterium]
MSEQFVNQIREGMHVEDADGDKVGTVLAIYQPVRVASTGFGSAEPAGVAYLKVHVGLPLLGKNLYIPSSAIRDVTADRIILTVDETRVGEQGWDERPSWIHE